MVDRIGSGGRPTWRTRRRSASSVDRASTRCSTTCARSRSTRRTAPPSDSLFLAEVAGRRVAFLPRHGRRHTHPAPPDQLPGQRLGDALARGQGRHLAVRRGVAPAARQAGRLRGLRPVRRPDERPGGHVLRRPDRHPPVVRRDVRPGPARAGHRDDPRPRHRGPRAGHGRRHPGPALLDQERVEVVQRRRLGGHQHDPVPGGVAVPRARHRGRQHQPHHRLRRRRPRGHRGGQCDRTCSRSSGQRGADPEGRARPHRPVPGGPRRARRAGRPGPDPRRRAHRSAPRTSGCSRRACEPDGGAGATADRGLPADDPRRARWWLESARRLDAAGYAGLWCWDHFMGRGDKTVPVVECVDDPVDGRRRRPSG